MYVPLSTAGLSCQPDRSDYHSSHCRLVKPPSTAECSFWLFTAYFTIAKPKEANWGLPKESQSSWPHSKAFHKTSSKTTYMRKNQAGAYKERAVYRTLASRTQSI